jgi:hypothetical protein
VSLEVQVETVMVPEHTAAYQFACYSMYVGLPTAFRRIEAKIITQWVKMTWALGRDMAFALVFLWAPAWCFFVCCTIALDHPCLHCLSLGPLTIHLLTKDYSKNVCKKLKFYDVSGRALVVPVRSQKSAVKDDPCIGINVEVRNCQIDFLYAPPIEEFLCFRSQRLSQ